MDCSSRLRSFEYYFRTFCGSLTFNLHKYNSVIESFEMLWEYNWTDNEEYMISVNKITEFNHFIFNKTSINFYLNVVKGKKTKGMIKHSDYSTWLHHRLNPLLTCKNIVEQMFKLLSAGMRNFNKGWCFKGFSN